MINLEAAPTTDQRNAEPPPPPRPPWRRVLGTGIIGLCLALIVAGGYLTLSRSGPGLNRQPVGAPPTPITYWPGPTNTGVPVGTALRNSGSITVTKDGTVLTGLNMIGCITIKAKNVQILKSKIACNSPLYAIHTLTGTVNLLIQDVEINSTGTNSASICCSDYTVRRANIYNMIDGLRLGTNTTLVDSYVHNLARLPLTHNDIAQSTGGNNILVQHNRLESYDPVTGDPFNSCVTIGSETAPSLTNMLVTDNYCNGGNYSIGINTKTVGANIVFQNNKFGRNYRYGVVANYKQPGVTWASSNVWFDTGLPVIG